MNCRSWKGLNSWGQGTRGGELEKEEWCLENIMLKMKIMVECNY